MEEKYDVKETMEILDGIEVLAEAAGKISADGKVDTSDLIHLIDVAKNFNVLADAAEGADIALKEIKDLDEMESLQILTKVFAIVKKFKEAKA